MSPRVCKLPRAPKGHGPVTSMPSPHEQAAATGAGSHTMPHEERGAINEERRPCRMRSVGRAQGERRASAGRA
jgi:hypothetical protein